MLNVLVRIYKNTQILIFIKICPVGAELFKEHRWTDMFKLFFLSDTQWRLDFDKT
jgi:hypothetical protein